jgi:hypothetical protein
MKNSIWLVGILFATVFMFSFKGYSQNNDNPLHQGFKSYVKQIPHMEKQGTTTRLNVDGNSFLLISGELHNSTAGGFQYMKPIWRCR